MSHVIARNEIRELVRAIGLVPALGSVAQ
jgi:hypothetical protein